MGDQLRGLILRVHMSRKDARKCDGRWGVKGNAVRDQDVEVMGDVPGERSLETRHYRSTSAT